MEGGKVLPSPLPSKTKERKAAGVAIVILNMVKGSSKKQKQNKKQKPKVVPKWRVGAAVGAGYGASYPSSLICVYFMGCDRSPLRIIFSVGR